ncbi:AfsR/SARP family transcriptional regulator [Nonomuraea turcica]|uniref:AfsR/SARP family transcriptional regulator n=1 Tax=Nonomuraea sp. G32 TaxID=3067274 RepID=UPI00273B1FEB|nr:BTAD domain-containing putative transcriptional regulator [Nonomuraea sp. G32]MDP4500506.1 BTAD domain-containing putative transcriptional regulator [Nonomuraea sp. G32]
MPITAAKQRTVLAALLLNLDRALSVDDLVDIVWDYAPPRAAKVTLHTYLSKLRGILHSDCGATMLTSRSGGYMLDIDRERFDVHRFERLVEQARGNLVNRHAQDAAVTLRTALDLWRGDALADVESEILSSADGRRLEEYRLAVTEEWAELELTLGRHAQLLPELRKLVERYPLSQTLRAQLMLTLYRLRRPAEALQEYQDTYQLLRNEAGLEPMPALQSLQQSILAADPALDWNPPQRTSLSILHPGTLRPFQLPPAVPELVNRETEIECLHKHLLGRNTLSAPAAFLTGMPGAGKSALAVKLAHAIAAEFPDGVLYLDLGATDQPLEPVEALGRIIRSYTSETAALPADLSGRIQHYRSLIAGRRVLVVLEDALDEAQVRPLLPATSGCAALVTGGRRLPGLDGAHVTVGMLPHRHGLAMLRTIVGQRRIAAEPDAADEVVAACGGLPLALRLAGARLAARPDWSMAFFAGRMRDPVKLFADLSVGDIDLRRVLSGGLAGCGGPEIHLFRHATSLGEEFGANELTAGEDRSEMLGALVQRHLIEAGQEAGENAPRYSVHPLLRLLVAIDGDGDRQHSSPAQRALKSGARDLCQAWPSCRKSTGSHKEAP